MPRPASAKSILKKMKFEPKVPISEEMFLPNQSGDHSAGSVRQVPSQDSDIANKKYVDDSIFTLPSLTAGSVIFSDGTTLAQDNSKLFWDDTEKRFGVGLNDPEHLCHIKDGSRLHCVIERNPTVNSSGLNISLGFKGTTTGNMTSGFGPVMLFLIEDVQGVENEIAAVGGVRDGADDSGSLILGTFNAGTFTEKARVKPDGKFGFGTTAPITTIDVNGGIALATIGVSANDTILVTDHTILMNAAGGARTLTLPAVSVSTGLVLNIKKIDSSANAVTVDGNASETIDGGTTAVLNTQYESISIHCDGTEWWII